MVPYFYFSWIKPSEYSTMAHKHDLADLELNAPPNNTELNEPLLDTPDLEQNSCKSQWIRCSNRSFVLEELK